MLTCCPSNMCLLACGEQEGDEDGFFERDEKQ
jgi:hypothetical protein